MVKKSTLTQENFLDLLSLEKVRKELQSNDKTNHLFGLLADYVDSIGETSTETETSASNELEMRIPGTAIHVQLSGFLKSKLQDFVAMYLILSGASEDNWVKISVGALAAFADKVKRLKVERGELCIVETLPNAYSKSSQGVCEKLFGNRCLYPKSMCQFTKSKTGTCQFNEGSIKDTMNLLKEKGVLKQHNAVEPIQWSIVV